jgi:DNA-binding NarL/FixJ family response regulator
MDDDAAFADLPSLLARSVGARSCVIHWRDTEQQAEILSHSQYFRDEHMLNYANNFVEHDLWTNRANEPGFVNRVWNAEELVAQVDYDRSIFYNEWIRALGDDTFHCMGTVMETGRGLGIIGLHRCKTQANFDADAVKTLNRNIVHLRRMLTVRARMVNDSAKIRDLTALLDCNPAPMMALTASARIVHANAAAEALFVAGVTVRNAQGNLVATIPAAQLELSHALARASKAVSPEASVVAINASGGHQLELTFTPASHSGTGLVLVTGHDPDANLRAVLQPLGGDDRLAPREVMVARLVGRGLRNHDIAVAMGVTEGTVKVYLHNVFAKVGVTTRTELALLVGGRPPSDAARP